MEKRQRTMEAVALIRTFGGCYSGRKVLVTGHTGFQGSWVCLWLSILGAPVTGLAPAPETRPAHLRPPGLQGIGDRGLDLRHFYSGAPAVGERPPGILFH